MVLSSGGLRIREKPTLQGKPLGILANNSICVSTVRQDNWIQHSEGWSMFENGGKVFARVLTSADYPVYEVISKGGLRSRESPSATAKETVVLPTGTTIFCLETQGFWVRHPEGWSMMHSDPSKGDKKIFLVEKNGQPKVAEPEPVPVAASPPASPSLAPLAISPPAISADKMKVKRASGNSESGDESPGRRALLDVSDAYERKARPLSGKKEEATEADLDAYKETMRAMCLDDRLSADELRFLAEMRRQRLIKEKQHFAVLAELGISKERFTAMIKNDRDENKGFAGRSCVSCMDASADHVILRCFHLCLCERCAGELRSQPAAKQKCPKCSAVAQEIQKVY